MWINPRIWGLWYVHGIVYCPMMSKVRVGILVYIKLGINFNVYHTINIKTLIICKLFIINRLKMVETIYNLIISLYGATEVGELQPPKSWRRISRNPGNWGRRHINLECI